MAGESKIVTLNRVLRELVASFASASFEVPTTHVEVAFITFGGEARLVLTLQSADQADWQDFEAGGTSRLAEAIERARGLIREQVSADAYQPVLLLLSDGYSSEDDPWAEALGRCLAELPCARGTIRIGLDADERMLRGFLDTPAVRLFGPEESLLIVHHLARQQGTSAPAAAVSTRFPSLPNEEDDDLAGLFLG
jgi:uncharacterized protein YegL